MKINVLCFLKIFERQKLSSFSISFLIIAGKNPSNATTIAKKKLEDDEQSFSLITPKNFDFPEAMQKLITEYCKLSKEMEMRDLAKLLESKDYKAIAEKNWLEKLLKSQLQEICTNLNLSKSGKNKQVLVNRLQNYYLGLRNNNTYRSSGDSSSSSNRANI